jgi:Spy/CpxP family protein refolding chaperone
MTKMITRTMGGMAVLFAAAVLIAGFPVLAQSEQGQFGPPEGRGMHRGERMMERLAETLELTEEQRVELEAIFAENPRGKEDEGLSQARNDLRAVIQDPAASEQDVLEAVQAVSTETERVALERHRMTQQISKILTAEQMQKLAELRQERPRGHRHGRHHGGGRSGDDF